MTDATDIGRRQKHNEVALARSAPPAAAGTGGAARVLLPPAVLSNALVFSAVATALVGVAILYGAGGWEYYRTPLAVRAYAPAHAALRPSGSIGHLLGIAGMAMMVVPVLYSVRKKWRRLRRLGSMRVWLEVHIFCGIVGPVLVTFHSALKFNGVISVAYWSMVAVALSGFVGRYLYVRMPRSIKGVELTYEEIAARADELHAALVATGVPASLVARLDVLPGLAPRRFVELRSLRRALARAGVSRTAIREAVQLAAGRAVLLRRLTHLQRTRRLFAMWHVVHQPLVYVMFAIALVHIGVAIYFGYAFFAG